MIAVTLLDVHISALHPIDFGANAGSSIRGALYEALRAMYDSGDPARHRDDDSNPVAWLLRLEDHETSGGKDVPRPIAIRPPLGEPAHQMTFGLSLYGRAHEHTALVLSALHAMQRVGLGRGRARFTIERIDQLDPLTHQATPLLDGSGKQLNALRPAPTKTAYERLSEVLDPASLTAEFLTPTRIIYQGKLRHRPEFKPWFQRLLERTRLISEVYTSEPVWVPFKDLLAVAEGVDIVQDDTRWVELWSGSRRAGRMRPASGFAGTVSYSGQFGELLPWLLLGQALQVGKNTVKGSGWYRLHYRWAS